MNLKRATVLRLPLLEILSDYLPDLKKVILCPLLHFPGIDIHYHWVFGRLKVKIGEDDSGDNEAGKDEVTTTARRGGGANRGGPGAAVGGAGPAGVIGGAVGGIVGGAEAGTAGEEQPGQVQGEEVQPGQVEGISVEICKSWPKWIWVLMLIAYFAAFLWRTFDKFKEQVEKREIRWKWQAVLAAAAFLIWYFFDKCREFWWFVIIALVGGAAIYLLYLYLFRKNIREEHAKVESGSGQDAPKNPTGQNPPTTA